MKILITHKGEKIMSDFSMSKKDWNKIINFARAREDENGDEIGGMAIVKKIDDGWIIS